MKYNPYLELKAKKWEYEIMRNTMSITILQQILDEKLLLAVIGEQKYNFNDELILE